MVLSGCRQEVRSANADWNASSFFMTEFMAIARIVGRCSSGVQEICCRVMTDLLPYDSSELTPCLIRSIGPSLLAKGHNELASFYFPHAQLPGNYGLSSFDCEMLRNHELTQRFTTGFSIRPFQSEHRKKCINALRQRVPVLMNGALSGKGRARDFREQCDSVRFGRVRISHDTTRETQDEPEWYVRRSVAIYLVDTAKELPGIAFDVCGQWLEDFYTRLTRYK